MFKTKKSICSCGRELGACVDVSPGMEPMPPQQNDITVCGYCGVVGIFDGNGNCTPMSEEEFELMGSIDPEFYNYLLTIRSKIKEHHNETSKI